MKKLVLAPVVALAITGLAASPVIAAPNSGDAFSRTGVQTPATGGESKTAEADVQKIEASVSVSPTEISQTDLADAKKGVDVTVTGLEAGDVVTDSLTGEETVAEGATVTFTIINDSGDPEKVPAGPVDFTVTVDRGTESATYDASFTVTPDETEEPTAPAVDPKAKFASEKISVSEIESKGLKFSGEGFTPGGTVSIEGISTPQSGDKAGVQAAQAGTQADIITADEDGKITGTLIAPEGAAKVGKYVVAFVDDKTGEKTEAVEFTVTEDATEEPTTPAADAKLIISPRLSARRTSSIRRRASRSPSRTASPAKTSASSSTPRATSTSRPSTAPSRPTTRARRSSTSTAPRRRTRAPTSATTR